GHGHRAILMATLRRSPQAEIDLETILEELQQHASAIAERYATAFDEKGRMLAQFPELGRLRPEIAPQLRRTLVRPYQFDLALRTREIICNSKPKARPAIPAARIESLVLPGVAYPAPLIMAP